MTITRIAHTPALYTIREAHPDGSTTPVPDTETTDRTTAIEHGRRLMREYPDAAFTLYEGATPRDRFGHKTLKLRLRADAIEAMVAL